MAYGFLSPYRSSRIPVLGSSFFPGNIPGRDLHTQLGRLFGDAWPELNVSALGDEDLTTLSPNIDVTQTDDAITITAELPGIDEKDVDVSVVENTLTIKGEKNAERDEEKETLHIIERSYGSFARSFTLPPHVDQGAINADFSKGVLTLTLPKTVEEKEKVKKITVKSK